MKQFLSFVRKEFIHILRDPRSLLILLVMPQILVLLLGFVIKNEVKDIRVAVLDQSHDQYRSRSPTGCMPMIILSVKEKSRPRRKPQSFSGKEK